MPIKIVRQVAYELKPIELKHNFDEEKDEIIKYLKNNVYTMKDNRCDILEENFSVTQIDEGYILSYYLKCSLQLKYN